MKVNIGLSDQDRTGVIDILNVLLADQNILSTVYTMTRNYHGNVIGPTFHLALQFHLPAILTQHTDLPGLSRLHGCPEALEQSMRGEKQQGRVISRGKSNEGGRQCAIIVA